MTSLPIHRTRDRGYRRDVRFMAVVSILLMLWCHMVRALLGWTVLGWQLAIGGLLIVLAVAAEIADRLGGIR